MDFELTDDQRRIRDVAREFAQAELGEKIAPYDARHEFPHAIVEKLGPLGFLGVLVPEEYGGSGLDYVAYALIVEELNRGDARSASRCGPTTRSAPTTSTTSGPSSRSGTICRRSRAGRCWAPGA
jgi:alkylation response protein AidB-like acyl-CoA dehydrogenase